MRNVIVAISERPPKRPCPGLTAPILTPTSTQERNAAHVPDSSCDGSKVHPKLESLLALRNPGELHVALGSPAFSFGQTTHLYVLPAPSSSHVQCSARYIASVAVGYNVIGTSLDIIVTINWETSSCCTPISSNSADGVHTFSSCEMCLCERVQVIATAQEYYEDAGCARIARYLEGENSNLVALAHTQLMLVRTSMSHRRQCGLALFPSASSLDELDIVGREKPHLPIEFTLPPSL